MPDPSNPSRKKLRGAALRVALGQPRPQEERRETMLTALDVRFRDVRQGPDGYLYVATEKTGQDGPGSAKDSPDGAILRIEPAR